MKKNHEEISGNENHGEIFMRKRFDWEGFKSEISGIRFEDGKEFVASRSKDYYWYSPILDEIFRNKIGDLVVIPSNQEQVQKVAAAIAKYKIPSRVVIFNEFPLNSMGKVRKDILRESVLKPGNTD